MPAISFFADGRDVNLLVDRLNADPEIAFLVPDGPLDPEVAYVKRLRAFMGDRRGATFYGELRRIDDGYRQRWKAVGSVEGLKDGNHSLWHVPAGPLPLLLQDGPDRVIPDPWEGWTEQRPGADPTTPYFGAAHPAVIHLELWARHRPYTEEEKGSLPLLDSHWDGDQDLLVASDFGWIGGWNGRPPAQTRRWWNRLKAWFGRTATPLADGRVTFWAFPSALRKLKGGMAYYCRGFELSESIRAAEAQLRCLEARDLFAVGPVTIDPAWLRWNGGTVSALACRIYDERAFHDLPVLADALEEAGCTDADLLGHLRGPGPHVRGCWAIDLLLGRN